MSRNLNLIQRRKSGEGPETHNTCVSTTGSPGIDQVTAAWIKRSTAMSWQGTCEWSVEAIHPTSPAERWCSWWWRAPRQQLISLRLLGLRKRATYQELQNVYSVFLFEPAVVCLIFSGPTVLGVFFFRNRFLFFLFLNRRFRRFLLRNIFHVADQVQHNYYRAKLYKPGRTPGQNSVENA